jgi:hypothetical protein
VTLSKGDDVPEMNGLLAFTLFFLFVAAFIAPIVVWFAADFPTGCIVLGCIVGAWLFLAFCYACHEGDKMMRGER